MLAGAGLSLSRKQSQRGRGCDALSAECGALVEMRVKMVARAQGWERGRLVFSMKLRGSRRVSFAGYARRPFARGEGRVVLRPWWSDAARRAPNCRRAGAPAACAPDEGATGCDSWRSESNKRDATRCDAMQCGVREVVAVVMVWVFA